MTTPLDHALALWARGLSVFPVPAPQPGVAAGNVGDGKVPAIAWREFQERLPTEAEVRHWFSGQTFINLAVITGRVSDVVVIDADDEAAVRWCTTHLPYTAWQTETARGFHLWYRHSGDGRVGNRARIDTRDGRVAIDVRGDGGYVIAPGSIHASGARYRYAGDWGVSRADLPRFWPGWLVRAPHPPSSSPHRASRRDSDVLARARAYLASIPRPEIGAGSDAATLYTACRLVRGFDLPASDATALLWEWAGGRSGWTWDWVARKVAHAERYGTEPIGALR